MKDTVNTTLFDLLLYAMIDLKSSGGNREVKAYDKLFNFVDLRHFVTTL